MFDEHVGYNAFHNMCFQEDKGLILIMLVIGPGVWFWHDVLAEIGDLEDSSGGNTYVVTYAILNHLPMKCLKDPTRYEVSTVWYRHRYSIIKLRYPRCYISIFKYT